MTISEQTDGFIQEGVIWAGTRRHLTREWAPKGKVDQQVRQAVCNSNTFTYDLKRVNRYRKAPISAEDVPKCRSCLKKFPEWS